MDILVKWFPSIPYGFFVISWLPCPLTPESSSYLSLSLFKKISNFSLKIIRKVAFQNCVHSFKQAQVYQKVLILTKILHRWCPRAKKPSAEERSMGHSPSSADDIWK